MKHLLLVGTLLCRLFADMESYKEGEHLYFQKGCNNCHGTNAEGSSYYPPLARKNKSYLKEKLLAFKRGKASSQKAEVMFTFTKNLNEMQIEKLSSFLAEFQETDTQKYQISDDILGGKN